MKKWVNPEFKVLNISKTTYGPWNQTIPDSELTAEFDEFGNVKGYRQLFGQASGTTGETGTPAV
uniref:hypothetical protein n=1 Tax=Eubacterium cellulosolvens TaxID=29322 RepID=UPI00048A219F|nr:hypothetical protein [[Eubacterium] cellulosolvens]